MSNYESRRLERVATAVKISSGADTEQAWRIARAVLRALNPRPRKQPVAWQARPLGGGDWFEADYPDRHNDPEKFEYRPLYTDEI